MITREDLLDKLINGAVWNTGVTFERTNPVPIEKYSIFESLSAAQEYAQNNPVAYPGQTLAVITEEGAVTLYIITADKSAPEKSLQEVGSKTLGDNASITLAADGTLSLYGFKEAVDGYLPQKSNGKIKWIAISEIVKGDGNTVTNGDTKSIDTAGDDKELTASLHGFEAASTNYIPYKDADGTLKWKAEYSYDDSGVKGRLDTLEGKFTEDAANDALKLGGVEAAAYQKAAELKALAKKDKVAEDDLETKLANKINGKAEQSALDTANGKITVLEGKFTGEDAKNALSLGGKAASEYQLKSELNLGDLAAKNKVAKSDLATELSTELDAKAVAETVNAELAKKASKEEVNTALGLKADKTYVDDQLALKATVVAQEATEAKAQKNKEDIATANGKITAVEGKVEAIEGAYIKSVEYVSSTGLFTFTLQDGTTKEVDLAIEKVVTNFVYDADKQALVLTLADKTTQEVPLSSFIKDYTAAQGAKEVQLAISAGKEISATLVKSVKDDIAKGVDAQTRVAAVEGEVDALNNLGITSDKVSKWDNEVGAKAATATNAQGLADLKAVVENEVTGLAATKKIADDAALAAADEKGALAKAIANEEALKTKVEQNAFDILNETVTNSSTGLVKKVGDLETSVGTKAEQSDLTALQNKVDDEKTGLATKASTEALNAVKAIAEAAQTAEQVEAAIGKANIAQSQVTGLDTALSGKENAGVAQELVNALTGEVTGTPAADSTITALAQSKGKVTATVSKITIAQSQVTGLPEALAEKQTADQVNELIGKANIAQDHVTGLPAALQALQAKDEELAGKITALEKLTPAEAGAQVNKLEAVKVNGVALDIAEDKSVELPKAMADSFGLVKGNAVENGVDVNEGLMSVHSLNVNKLVQSEGEYLVLDGGNAELPPSVK